MDDALVVLPDLSTTSISLGFLDSHGNAKIDRVFTWGFPSNPPTVRPNPLVTQLLFPGPWQGMTQTRSEAGGEQSDTGPDVVAKGFQPESAISRNPSQECRGIPGLAAEMHQVEGDSGGIFRSLSRRAAMAMKYRNQGENLSGCFSPSGATKKIGHRK